MRIIARFEKGRQVRFVSHLDILRLFQRAFNRAQIPVAYSQGFNPHPLLAFATALPVGYSSSAEWLDIKLTSEMAPEVFMQAVNAALPEGFSVLEAICAQEKYPSLSAVMAAAKYTVTFDGTVPSMTQVEQLTSAPIMVDKRTKAGMRCVDIRPQVYSVMKKGENTLHITGTLSASGSLNIDLLLGSLSQLTGPLSYLVHRDAILSSDGEIMPKYLD